MPLVTENRIKDIFDDLLFKR